MSRKEKKAAEKAEEAVEQQESMRVDLYEWIQSLMTALVICMAIFIFIIRVIDVSGSSPICSIRRTRAMSSSSKRTGMTRNARWSNG